LVALVASGAGSAAVASSAGHRVSSSAAARSANDAGDAAACQAKPRAGGNLVYDRANETVTLNPLDIRNGNGDIFAINMIYQGLVQYAPNGSTTVVGGVAKNWSVSPNGKVYTFHLRPGVKFSNGQPVTAQDVVFSLNNFGNPKVNQVMSVVATGYGNAKAMNSHTVQVTLKKPVPAFLDDIAIFPAFILPEKLVQSEGKAFWTHPIGSGPFTVKNFVSGSHITFGRNPYYWDKPLPYLNSVTFNFATNSDSRLLALTSGTAQEADVIEPSQVASVRGNKSLILQTNSMPAWISIFPNEKHKPFANTDVRLAMAYAINRQQIKQQIFHGLGAIPNSVLGHFPMDAPTSKVPAYSYNPAKARQLLAKAGYKNGFSVALSYPSGLDYFSQMALLLQQDLGQVGIKVHLLQQDPATMIADFSASKFQLSFGYPQMTTDVGAPDEFAQFYALPNPTHSFFTGWSNAGIASQVQQFVTNTSTSQRAQEWPKIQAALMGHQGWINILDQPLVSAHAKNVCGTLINTLGVDQLWYTWLAGK
jgi:peptide/nickel transport system substrate-binding protein